MASEHYKRSIDVTTDFVLYKKVTEAPEAGPFITKEHGVNSHAHEYAVVDVAPAAGGNPNVEVLFWSDRANGGNGAFVAENPQLTKTGLGADTPYQFSFPSLGRLFFVAVTGGLAAGQSAEISVSGYGLDHTL